MTVPAPFTYSGNPSTSVRDEVRFLILDTDSTCPLLTDLELDYIIDKWMVLYQSPVYCASIAAATIARKWAKVVNVGDSGTSAQVGDLQARYTAMAQQLRCEYEEEGNVGGLADIDNILTGTTWDPSIDPLSFAMGIDDNRRAGSQDWGALPTDNPYADVANEGLIL